MNFINELINGTDITFITAIIVFIQFVKQFTKSMGFKVNNDIWKLVVWVMGIGASFLSFPINNISFNWATCIRLAFIYSSASTLIYQTGKLGISKLPIGDSNGKESNNGN